MKSEKKISVGAFLAAVGSVGIILGFLAGIPDLTRPWGFLVGFALGVISGLGATLTISGLLDRRHGL